MDNETAKYIINYFSGFLTDTEKIAVKHHRYLCKLEDPMSDNTKRAMFYKKTGRLTSDQNALDLLEKGYDKFEINVANRILTQHADKVFLNNCSKCNKLARTPFAKQCRHCGHDWHASTAS
ncbi:MAG: hypothetical protein H7Y04_11695 [Verrucomicrobia bacterium]|nr:hypothetical protein [Cytophagales bacterium]